jgi:hypothetical protein
LGKKGEGGKERNGEGEILAGEEGYAKVMTINKHKNGH